MTAHLDAKGQALAVDDVVKMAPAIDKPYGAVGRILELGVTANAGSQFVAVRWNDGYHGLYAPARLARR